MAHLIDKDAVLAEIERRKQWHKEMEKGWASSDHFWKQKEDDEIISIINSFKEKEVDYDKALTEYLGNFENASIGHRLSIRRTAKHFFELGLKASNPLTWEDMMLIHKCCKDAMNRNLYAWQTAEGQQKIYEDVLKRFKAQKGE